MLSIKKNKILILGSQGSIGKDLVKYLFDISYYQNYLFKNKKQKFNIDLTKKLKNKYNFEKKIFLCNNTFIF